MIHLSLLPLRVILNNQTNHFTVGCVKHLLVIGPIYTCTLHSLWLFYHANAHANKAHKQSVPNGSRGPNSLTPILLMKFQLGHL